MNTFFFWREWNLSYRLFYNLQMLLFVLLLVGYGLVLYRGDSNVIEWTAQGNLVLDKAHLYTTKHLFYDLKTDIDLYLYEQFYEASPLIIDTLPSHIFVLVLTFAFASILTAATYLKRTWFLIANIGVIAFLAATNLNILSAEVGVLRINDINNMIMLILIGSIASVGIGFHTFGLHSGFWFRFLSYCVVFAGMGYYLIFHYSQFENTVFFIANFGIIIPVILSILFIAFNAHEIVHFLFRTALKGNHPHAKRQFLIASGLYVCNLLYAFFHSFDFLDFDIVFLSPFCIFPITVVLSIWGFRSREVHYQNLFSFAPYGAILFMGLAILSVATVAFVLVTGNTPMIEVFEDSILFSHIAFGASFILYVFVNFGDLMGKGLPIEKVLWNPKIMDFHLTSFAGIFLIVVFLMRYDFFIYDQFKAGYNNTIGDVYFAEGSIELSKQYYQLAMGHEYRNHRSNYALGSILKANGDRHTAVACFKQATEKTPSPYAFASLASLYMSINQPENALNSLRKGVEKFPSSVELQNNLGLLYAHMDSIPQAQTCFEKALEYADEPHYIQANWFRVWASKNLKGNPDEKMQVLDFSATESNRLAYWLKNGKIADAKPFYKNLIQDTTLQTQELCYLYMYGLNHFQQADNEYDSLLFRFENVVSNADFQNYLLFVRCHRLMQQANAREAIMSLRNVYDRGGAFSPQYAYSLATWLLVHKQYKEAAYYFQKAMLDGRHAASFERALMLSELPDKKDAIELWSVFDTIAHHPIQPIASSMLRALRAENIENLSTEEKLLVFRYRQADFSDDVFIKNLSSFAEAKMRNALIAHRSEYYMEKKDTLSASKMLPLLDAKHEDGDIVRMKIGYAQKDISTLQKLISKSYQKNDLAYSWATFYKGKLAQDKRNFKEAQQYFEQAIKGLPFEQSVYMGMVDLLNSQNKPEEAYHFLLKALETLPDAPEINRLYILQCLRLRYVRYAEEQMIHLSVIAEKPYFEAFQKEYEALRKITEERFSDWN